MKQFKIGRLVYFLPFIIVAVFFIFVPLLLVLIQSFKPVGGSFGLANYQAIFSNAYYMMGIRNSIYVSVVSSVIGLIIAFFCAYSIYVSGGRWKTTFVNIMNMTSNFQGIQLAFAFMILLGNSGTMILLGQKFGIEFLSGYDLYSVSGIMITFIYFQIPLATLLLYPSFDSIKKEYWEAASLLNANRFQFWTRVAIPIVLPSLFGIFSILFSNALAAYATPYALLGNNYPLLPIQISGMFTGDVVQRVDLGSAMSMILILLMGLATVLSNFALKKLRKGA